MYKHLLSFIICLFLSASAIAQVDTTIGVTAPGDVSRNYKDLAHYLCDNLTGDKEKANAIYNWITHNIRYDVKYVQKGSMNPEKVEKVLKERKGVCSGYSELFTDMCREAGLKAVNIEGYAKDWIFDNGDKLYVPRHMWSAVCINGKWQYIDATWGAGGMFIAGTRGRALLSLVTGGKIIPAKKLKFRPSYDPQYFMQPPQAFSLTHLPADPVWQLADTTMPLQLFEAGDSSVTQFNKNYSKPMQKTEQLAYISQLDEDHRTQEYADRAYKYNSRFAVILAVKQEMIAITEVKNSLEDSNARNIKTMLNDAKVSLKKSEQYIKEQRKDFPAEYSALKKKNKVKNQEAKKYIRVIKTDDKRLVSESKKYTRATKSKFTRIKKKYADANKVQRSISPGKIDDVEAAKAQKREDAPELVAMKDSIAARRTRSQSLRATIAANDALVATRENENKARLDTLAATLHISDSLLVRETLARINLHDNYDDDVIQCSNIFKKIKYQQADTLEKYYLVTYDSVNAVRDRQLKTRKEQMDLYKKDLRCLEQYKKWNSSNPALSVQYQQLAKEYIDSVQAYNATLAAYSNYVRTNKKLFSNLAQVNKRQIKITGYMSRAEEMRQKMEEKTLAKKQAFDVAENQKQSANVKAVTKKVQRMADQVD